jgi:DNA processing protein
MIGIGPAGPLGIGGVTVMAAGGDAEASALSSGMTRSGEVPPGADVTDHDDRPFWIALSLIPGVGPVGFRRIIQRYGSARAAWDAGPRILEHLPRRVDEAPLGMRRLMREGPVVAAQRVEEATQRSGGIIVTALEAAYPASLAAVEPRPPVLYVRGDLRAVAGSCVALVGTRRASGYGRASAAALADELARAGVVVVSGLAVGIDAEAHTAAIVAGGRSVAVLPSPLNRIYPPRHGALAERLVTSGGALLTEVPPGQPTGRPDFARRNRIIAGLSQAVVVVEAPDHSGALLTASAAIAYDKELYAVPGPIDAVSSRGCNRLIADQQATLITSPAMLLQRIGARHGAFPVTVSSLSESEGLVLAALLKRSASIEELMQGTQLATGSLASTLTLLEARGLATSYGGATFHATLAARRIGRVP